MLRCTSHYRSGAGVYAPGDVITDPALCAFLLLDSPGSFESVEQEERAPKKRAAN